MIIRSKIPGSLVATMLVSLVLYIPVYSQSAPQNIDNNGVYEFLDELANAHLISINQAIKPYSRLLIASKLYEVDGKREMLNNRQLKELDFYLRDFYKELETSAIADLSGDLPGNMKDFGKAQWFPFRATVKGEKRFDAFYYKDSLFSITVNPIIGGEFFNNSTGVATYSRNGAEVRAYVGKWAFYASLRDNHETDMLGKPGYLTQRRGGHIKNGTDYSEMQGGITYQWSWGDIGLKKDNFAWGTNYNGANIFSGRVPSFTYLNIHIQPVEWFEFNYIHGWLNSMVVDSTSSYWVSNSYGDDYREKYHKKFLATNMFTFIPLKHLNISVGNSVVYDDASANPAYLFPLFFYKSIDHSMTSGIDNMNSQMFIDVSSRQIKNVHLYATLFVDELSVKRFTKDDEWNFFSWKAGTHITNFPIDNLGITGEFTYTYPLTFQHYVPTTTFESNRYNMGHYLTDNAREWYFALSYKPVRALDIKVSFTDIIRGPDYTVLGGNRLGLAPLASIEWTSRTMGVVAKYQIINDLYVWAGFEHGNISGTDGLVADYFYGNKNTFNGGLVFGF